MIEPIQAECVIAVAESGSFRQAAKQLSIAQPSVSAHIARLERALGVAIFDRGPHGTTITVDGTRIIPYLRAFLAAQDVVQREAARATDAGRARLSIASHRIGMTWDLPPVLRILKGAVGPVDVQLHHMTERAGSDAVLDGRVDLALSLRPGGAQAANDGVLEELLEVSRPVMFVAPGHPLADLDLVSPADLAGQTLVSVQVSPLTNQFFDRWLHGVDDVDRYEVTDMQVGLRMVEEGVGVMIAVAAAHRLASPALRQVPVAGVGDVELTIVRKRDQELSAPAAIVWELLRG